MLNLDKCSTQSIINIHYWADNLCSIEITRPSDFKFCAGQFARVGIQTMDGTWLFRALSVVSSPYAETLMFLISIIPAGAFSQYVKRLQVGNVLALEKLPFGYLTLARFQAPAPQHLWLLATGTGVAPFLSMLQDFEVWQRYQHIVLVYSVRHAAELAYQDEILAWVAQFNEAQIPFTYVPITTRDTATNFTQRIPALIASGVLAAHVGIPLDASTAHVMLCGNPQMVEDTRNTLKAQGLSMNRRGEGNIAVENYW